MWLGFPQVMTQQFETQLSTNQIELYILLTYTNAPPVLACNISGLLIQ